jgi:two-component system chemotaxis response regulator CheB
MPDTVHRDISVIGASAGGIVALRDLFAALPAEYPSAIFVAMHLAPESPSLLPDILDRVGPLPVSVAKHGARIRPRAAWVAPPDLHLVLEGDRMLLSRAPRENRHRPSIDVLFRSAAVAFGARVTGLILSGMLDDGAAGLWAIKR